MHSNKERLWTLSQLTTKIYESYRKEILHRSNYRKQNKIRKYSNGRLLNVLLTKIEGLNLRIKFKLNDGSYTADMKINCKKFNDFFLLMSVHSYSKRYPCKTAVRNNILYLLYLEPVIESEMRELINSLKSSAPGYDNITSFILKLHLPVVCTPLTLTHTHTHTHTHIYIYIYIYIYICACIRHHGAITWNKIFSVNINPESSEQSFKVMLKQCINQRAIDI